MNGKFSVALRNYFNLQNDGIIIDYFLIFTFSSIEPKGQSRQPNELPDRKLREWRNRGNIQWRKYN